MAHQFTSRVVAAAWLLAICAAPPVLAADLRQHVPTRFFTRAEYDESASQANRVDREANGNAKSLEQFRADVAAAYSNDLGGVCGFDDVMGYDAADGLMAGVGSGTSGRGGNYFWEGTGRLGTMPEPCRLVYGARREKSIRLKPDDILELWSNGAYGDGIGIPVSGPSAQKVTGTVYPNGNMITPQTDWRTGDTDHMATFEFIGTNREEIAEVAVTALSRNVALDWTVWVVLDNGEKITRTAALAAGSGADDVFFHFAAPKGRSIAALHWEVPDLADNLRPPIDDLALIIAREAKHGMVLMVF